MFFVVICDGSNLLFYFILSPFYFCGLLFPLVVPVIMKTKNIGPYDVSSIPSCYLIRYGGSPHSNVCHPPILHKLQERIEPPL